MLLRRKLLPFPFDPTYEIKNVGRTRNKLDCLRRQYDDVIRRNNRLDLELYEFVKTELYPRFIGTYGDRFQEDLRQFQVRNPSRKAQTLRPRVDYACRKLYYEPVTGIIRILHGLPAKGSYSSH